MPLPVLLKDVVEVIEPLSDEWQAYINRDTGELVSFTDEEAQLAEAEDIDDSLVPEWQQEILPKVREVLGSEAFVQLPDKFDFHEYRVMERFCLELDDSELQEELLDAIRGRGAFRRFKELIHIKGIDKAWYAYRERELKAFAAEFLEAEGISYVD
ncbi:UPF0158 family protein [Litchfieldella rifensis]|uniref:UPF0158 family protein n=1 Tax=Litchfieldella rifensis TaxID=762643 RepID=A0ABV7LKG0_9GAMM